MSDLVEHKHSVDDYRNAPSGEGPLAGEWADKPHRLVYDLCTQRTELEAEVERCHSIIRTEVEMTQLGSLLARAEKAEAALAKVAAERNEALYVLEHIKAELGSTLDQDFGFWSAPTNAVIRSLVWDAYSAAADVLKNSAQVARIKALVDAAKAVRSAYQSGKIPVTDEIVALNFSVTALTEEGR